LGQGLAHRAGMDYEQLVVTRICDPLHMNSTRITLSAPLRQRLAAGHGADLVTVRCGTFQRWRVREPYAPAPMTC
jgi:CubicO group peptidase (beta-lactamase class C family)